MGPNPRGWDPFPWFMTSLHLSAAGIGPVPWRFGGWRFIHKCPSQLISTVKGAEIPRRSKNHLNAQCGVSKPPGLVLPQLRDLARGLPQIRSVHDKSFTRWMPHINLLYPFLEDCGSNFEEAAQVVAKAVADIHPFQVLMDSPGISTMARNFHPVAKSQEPGTRKIGKPSLQRPTRSARI
eukprot:jgi/Botrbrau1/10054/Bobra.0355s0010.1